jgi:GrpB-like predicted nucleotidyltransferase (UPF0157 family)
LKSEKPRDTELRASQPVVLAEYDPRWPAEFAAEAERIRGAIGPWIEGIEHIGSTAVEGMPAKPVIDLLIGVRRLMQAGRCTGPLEKLGYAYVPQVEAAVPERRYFYKPEVHAHLVELGGRFWKEKLRFRDLLRADADLARRYAALKRDLAARFAHDRTRYSEGKSAFVERALSAQPAGPSGSSPASTQSR